MGKVNAPWGNVAGNEQRPVRWELCCHLDNDIPEPLGPLGCCKNRWFVSVFRVGWGGLVTFHGLCRHTHTHVMLRDVCFFVSFIHTYCYRRLPLFPAHVRHVALETSSVDSSTHTSCYAPLHASVVVRSVRSITTLWTSPVLHIIAKWVKQRQSRININTKSLK